MVELSEALQAGFSARRTVVVATDGSAKFSLAAASVVLHEGEAFAIGLEGEDQSSYCAELHALYLLARAVDRAAAAGAAGSLLVLTDCASAMQSVVAGWSSSHPLRCQAIWLLLRSAASAGLKTDLSWVPSHSKVTPRWMPHPLVDPAVQRLLNGRADDSPALHGGQTWFFARSPRHGVCQR